MLSSVRHTIPNIIDFTLLTTVHQCHRLSAQAANKCLKTHVGLPITNDNAAKSKWLLHDALNNFKLETTKITGHMQHKQEMADRA